MDERQDERYSFFAREILAELRLVRWLLVIIIFLAVVVIIRAWPDFWALPPALTEWWTDFMAHIQHSELLKPEHTVQ